MLSSADDILVPIGSPTGVGTFLTNDFRVLPNPSPSADPDAPPPSSDDPVSKPLNIVIKVNTVKGRPAVKISDDLTKNTGDPEEVRLVKRRFGLEEDVEGHPEDA